MSRIPTLLKKLQALHRQQLQIEQDIARIELEIAALGKGAKPRTKRRSGPEAVETIRPLVKALQAAGEAIKPGEIAARLGIAPSAVAYRLRKAMDMKFVAAVGGGRYQVTKAVPVAL